MPNDAYREGKGLRPVSLTLGDLLSRICTIYPELAPAHKMETRLLATADIIIYNKLNKKGKLRPKVLL